MDNLTATVANNLVIYRQALEICEENINKWKDHKREYTELNEQLELFPKKVSHDVMVPFGKVALMQGRLVHTNEVLVLLGDNWFTMRSAFQAKEIVDRRLKYVNETIKKYEEERNLYVDRLEAAKRLLDADGQGEYFEIRENAPPEKDQRRKVRIAHKPKTKTADSSNGQGLQTSSKKVTEEEFNIIMNHLDELNFGERGSGKPSTSNEKANNQDVKTPYRWSNSGSKVKWQDDVCSTDQAPSDSGVPPVLEADAKPVKSILKNRDELTPVGDLPPSAYEERPKVISSVTDEVFSGTVLERLPTESSSSAKEPVRRVSRFAQQRAAQKKE